MIAPRCGLPLPQQSGLPFPGGFPGGSFPGGSFINNIRPVALRSIRLALNAAARQRATADRVFYVRNPGDGSVYGVQRPCVGAPPPAVDTTRGSSSATEKPDGGDSPGGESPATRPDCPDDVVPVLAPGPTLPATASSILAFRSERHARRLAERLVEHRRAHGEWPRWDSRRGVLPGTSSGASGTAARVVADSEIQPADDEIEDIELEIRDQTLWSLLADLRGTGVRLSVIGNDPDHPERLTVRDYATESTVESTRQALERLLSL